jgi:hypothetical protein
MNMSKQPNQVADKNTPYLWIGIGLFWGTVFFATSTYFIGFFSAHESISFLPAMTQIFQGYATFFVLTVVMCLAAYVINKRIDPKGERRVKRQNDVLQGSREQFFISFLGSIGSALAFSVMTAGSYSISGKIFDADYAISVATTLWTAAANIGVGLAASAAVGVLFLVLKALGKLPQGVYNAAGENH